jgi:Protein of unknown function (DUF2971)
VQSTADLLYHYTNTAGLIGILTSGSLWATDVSFLNDAQEMRYGREKLVDALAAEGQRLIDSDAPAYGANYNRGTVMHSAADSIRTDTPPDGHPPVTVYIACFCEDGDLLSQWRGYAEGSGFAIGFRRDHLARLEYPTEQLGVGRNGTPLRLVKVAYGAAAIDGLIRRVLDEIVPQPRGHPGSHGWARAQEYVWPSLATIKHEAFREEQEWRLTLSAITDDSPRQFRSGPLGVTPYRTIEFNLAAVGEVVVGPGPEPDLRARGVKQLLNDVGATASVRHSTAPFRG